MQDALSKLGFILQKEAQAEFEQQECTICLTDFEAGVKVTALPCDERHFFHTDCIKKWAENQRYCCPLCNKEFTYESLTEVKKVKTQKSKCPDKVNKEPIETQLHV